MESRPVQFAILKFVPDEMRDEPINVGVVASADGELLVRLVPQTDRTRDLINKRAWDSLMTGLQFAESSLRRNPTRTLDELRKIYRGRLRLSSILGGQTPDVEGFVDKQFRRYVSQADVADKTTLTSVGERRTPEYATREPKPLKSLRQRESETMRNISTTVKKHGLMEPSKIYVRGEVEQHTFDFGFQNGRITLGKVVAMPPSASRAIQKAKIRAEDARDAAEALRKRGRHVEIVSVLSLHPDTRYEDREKINAILSRESDVVEAASVEGFIEELLKEAVSPVLPRSLLV